MTVRKLQIRHSREEQTPKNISLVLHSTFNRFCNKRSIKTERSAASYINSGLTGERSTQQLVIIVSPAGISNYQQGFSIAKLLDYDSVIMRNAQRHLPAASFPYCSSGFQQQRR